MKNLFFILLFSLFHVPVQNTLENVLSDHPEESIRQVGLSNLGKEDYQKFYIGFTYKQSSMEIITLDISDAQSIDSVISFQYVLGIKDSKETGTGIIFPRLAMIRFQNMAEGHINIDQNGKIIFESVIQDSSDYWKLQEK